MKIECENCESPTDEKDTVIVLDEDDNIMKAYCRRCWSQMINKLNIMGSE